MEYPRQCNWCFLRLASCYRKILPDFATVAYSLTRLTQKNVPFAWDSSCEKAFQTLKKLLVSSPILSYPNNNDTFVLDTDASNDGIGAVLSKIQNGEEKSLLTVIKFYLKPNVDIAQHTASC